MLRFYWQQHHPDADRCFIPDVSTLLASSVHCFNGLFPSIEMLDSMVSADYYQKKTYTSHIEVLLGHISDAEKNEPPTSLTKIQLERIQLRSTLGYLYSLEGNETRALTHHDLALEQLHSFVPIWGKDSRSTLHHTTIGSHHDVLTALLTAGFGVNSAAAADSVQASHIMTLARSSLAYQAFAAHGAVLRETVISEVAPLREKISLRKASVLMELEQYRPARDLLEAEAG